jgi:hypothetical protein
LDLLAEAPLPLAAAAEVAEALVDAGADAELLAVFAGRLCFAAAVLLAEPPVEPPLDPPHADTPIASAKTARSPAALVACLRLHSGQITIFLRSRIGAFSRLRDAGTWVTVTLSRRRASRIGGSTSGHHSDVLRWADAAGA